MVDQSHESPPHASHFESLERQADAARFGMWVFLGSEVLLFSGLFALYGSYRAHWPHAFDVGIEHMEVVLGSVNTVVLIVSSYFAALSVHGLERGKRRQAMLSLAVTLALGATFLVLKGVEYAHHLEDGMAPGGRTAFFRAQGVTGLESFVTLYYVSTGLHALHVVVGMTILAVFFVLVATRRVGRPHAHKLETAVLYWHLVDAIWIFLWPMYYLTGGKG